MLLGVSGTFFGFFFWLSHKNVRVRVRGPLDLLERARTAMWRAFFYSKKSCTSFEKNRKSVTKAQKAPDLGLLKCTVV